MKNRKESRIRLLSVLLAVFLAAQLFPVATQAAEGTAELAKIVETQIRAYADSIDQPGADSSAAADLASHGITGRGRKLTMGPSGSLTAALMNSELVQEGFAVIFADMIRAIQRLDMPADLSGTMSFLWNGTANKYAGYIFTDAEAYPDKLDWMSTSEYLKENLNAYDRALEWIAGNCDASIEIRSMESSGSDRSYRVDVTFRDRFDFSLASGSAFKNLLSGFGMLLFKEFDWSCSVSMEISVPYSYANCSHGSGAYRWTYDPEKLALISDSGFGYSHNPAAHRSFEAVNGNIHHYYELENTVRLFHDRPWVVEYDVTRPSGIILAPVDNAVTKTYPQLQHTGNTSLLAVSKDYVMAYNPKTGTEDRFYAYRYYGTYFRDVFSYDYKKTHTFRLENELLKDGGNRILLTVWETDTGNICVEKLPMDDHYYYGGWMEATELVGTESTWLSGRDIYINYVGTQITGLRAEHFALRIWENGQGAPDGSYFAEETSPATCTQAGSVQRTCTRCGFSEQAEEIPALGHDWAEADCLTAKTCRSCGITEGTPAGHSFGPWQTGRQPACLVEGLAFRRCVCGAEETQPLPALPHDYQKGSCRLCGEPDPEWLPGDVDGNGTLNYSDALLVLRWSIGLETLADPALGDVNGDGEANYADALQILRTSIGLAV